MISCVHLPNSEIKLTTNAYFPVPKDSSVTDIILMTHIVTFMGFVTRIWVVWMKRTKQREEGHLGSCFRRDYAADGDQYHMHIGLYEMLFNFMTYDYMRGYYSL